MNGPADIPLTHSSTPDAQPCSLISIIPTLGMSSCRGRAEAFARRLSSKLRTLGSQTDEESNSQEDEPIINGGATNTWVTTPDADQTVTDLQPLRHESDSFFDFDCELESPGSPVDECEYLRLIETASNTPHNSVAESGYACASAASSHSSNDGPYFDFAEKTQAPQTQSTQNQLSDTEHPKSADLLKVNGSTDRLPNGLPNEHPDDSSGKNVDEQGTQGQVAQSNRTTDETKTLPTTGPDVASTSSTVLLLKSSPEQPACNMTNAEMAKVQEQIIQELQKQSEQVPLTSATTSGNGFKSEAIKMEKVAMTEVDTTHIESKPTAGEVVHTITNGHTFDGEDMLQIELAEVEKPSTSTNITVTSATSTLTTSVAERVAERVASTDEKASNEQESNDEKVTTHIGIKTERKTEEEVEMEMETEAKVEAEAETSKAIQSEINAKESEPVDTTDDEDECRPQRVRRCSSLKTGKTPPGTPGRKKIVRFADVLGLDLADVKTFLDEIPTIPKSAFEDLEIMESEPPIQLGPKPDKLLMPLFQQPGGLTTFLDLVREKQVSLENAAVSDHINQTITGSVRVRNLDFHKSVHIRYSLDGWRSYADLQANYVQNSCDGFSDKFSFIIFGNSLHIGQRLEFAVRFQCKGQQFWDNNYGTNYCFQCLPASSPANNPTQPIAPSSHHHHHHQNNTNNNNNNNSNHITGILSPTAGDAWCSSFY